MTLFDKTEVEASGLDLKKTPKVEFDLNDTAILYDKDIRTNYKPLGRIKKRNEYETTEIKLSRPSSPDSSSAERYYFLIETCIKNEIIFQLTDKLKTEIKNRVGQISLMAEYESEMEAHLKEVNDNYCWAIKKSIVDYVLRDENEQKRLKLNMKKKVTFLNEFSNKISLVL